MATLKITLPDEAMAALQTLSRQMQQSTEELIQLALSFFAQSEITDNAAIAIERYHDGTLPLLFPAFEDNYDIKLAFHPDAKDELEAIEEEEQASIISHLIDRILQDDDEADKSHSIDLVLQEGDNAQLVLSRFPTFDVIYELGDGITVYLLSLTHVETTQWHPLPSVSFNADEHEDEDALFDLEHDDLEDDGLEKEEHGYHDEYEDFGRKR